MAALGTVGQVVHLGYWAHNLAAADFDDRRSAAEFLVFMEGTPFALATFIRSSSRCWPRPCRPSASAVRG